MKPPMKRRRTFQRRKVCVFCADSGMKIDYKDVKTLNHFVTERGKILPRRISGNCAKHQRDITQAIKKARNISPSGFFSVRFLTAAFGGGRLPFDRFPLVGFFASFSQNLVWGNVEEGSLLPV